MTIDEPSKNHVQLNRSPLAAGLDGLEQVRLTRELQAQLGCAVNRDVFLECPYAFVPRQGLLEASQESGSPLERLSGGILAWGAENVLVGYATERIEDGESGGSIKYLVGMLRARSLSPD